MNIICRKEMEYNLREESRKGRNLFKSILRIYLAYLYVCLYKLISRPKMAIFCITFFSNKLINNLINQVELLVK